MDKELEAELTKSGIRPTAVRLLVLKYLKGQSHALTLNAMEAGMERLDRVTLYRTIKTFQEKGLVHSIEDGTGTTKFALLNEGAPSTQDAGHVHFYCTRCNETYCLPETNAPELSLPDAFLPQKVNTTVQGICNKCSKLTNKN
jgi:Fur family ferric uptake transcriptional regulator